MDEHVIPLYRRAPEVFVSGEGAVLRDADGRVEHEVRHEEVDDSGEPIRLKLALESRGGEMRLDFTGTSPQQDSAYNAPLAVTRAVGPSSASLMASGRKLACAFRPVSFFTSSGCNTFDEPTKSATKGVFGRS